MIPPGIESEWDDNVPTAQGFLLAYGMIRHQEELKHHNDLLMNLAKILIPSAAGK